MKQMELEAPNYYKKIDIFTATKTLLNKSLASQIS